MKKSFLPFLVLILVVGLITACGSSKKTTLNPDPSVDGEDTAADGTDTSADGSDAGNDTGDTTPKGLKESCVETTECSDGLMCTCDALATAEERAACVTGQCRTTCDSTNVNSCGTGQKCISSGYCVTDEEIKAIIEQTVNDLKPNKAPTTPTVTKKKFKEACQGDNECEGALVCTCTFTDDPTSCTTGQCREACDGQDAQSCGTGNKCVNNYCVTDQEILNSLRGIKF